MESTKQMNRERFGFMNILVLVLSIYVLSAFFIDLIFKLPAEISALLNIFDQAICLVFFIDFVIRFRQAESKAKFMKWGWIDLLSSIPVLDFMRAGRLLRLVKLVRILRALRSARLLYSVIFRNKIQGAFSMVALIGVLTIIFSSIAILQVEDAPESNIKTAEDALWWTYTTITTVGYGDRYPVTTEGRFIAAILMTVGVGLFGTFTAYVASWFVTNTNEENEIRITNLDLASARESSNYNLTGSTSTEATEAALEPERSIGQN